MVVRRRVWSLVAAVSCATGGCSFLGANVPDKPPAPTTCPWGVIIADGLATSLFGFVTAIAAVTLFENNSNAAVFGYYALAPAGVLTLAYGSSTVYGARRSNRCEELRRAEPVQQETKPTLQRKPLPATRANVVGDAPVYCFESDAVLGACYFAETECSEAASRAKQICSPRTQAYCLDVTTRGADSKVLCAPTLRDCESRRRSMAPEQALDETLVVSYCSQYTQRRPALSP
jgi:hypothetical protein